MLKSLLWSATGVLVLLFAICQATLTLAGTTANVNGRVTDELGHPISGVHVSAVAPSFRINTTTGSNGFYAVTGLPPDTYTLTFAEEGYITQTLPGITLNQDQTYVQSMVLPREVKTLSRIPVRGSTSLVQPTQTVNQYNVNAQTIQAITGTPQNISETAVLNALPGVTTDSFGYPIIRGGAENDEGFELEGIDATEPISGQFINSLALNGVARLQLSTGGYDVSEANTNSGVVNVVSKRGVYPGSGVATVGIGSPAFNHTLALDYGGATPDNRFSYYYSFNGVRTNFIYGDGKTFYPRLLGQLDYSSGNDNAVNFFYHWGSQSQNELQYFADFGSNLFNTRFEIDPAVTPYATNNGVVQLFGGFGTGLFANPAVSLIDFAPVFPTQVGLVQNSNYPDHEDENHVVQKINFKHQFSPESFGEFRVFRTQSNVNFLLPWDGGAFGDSYEFDGSDNRGIAFDYSSQLSAYHDLSIGGETIFTKPNFSIAVPSSTLFTDPLECGLPCLFLGLTGNVNTDPTAPATYVGPLYNQIQGPFGLPPATQPLGQLPDNASHIYDNVHRTNAWIRDRWQPSSRWTVTFGVRWDQEILGLPSNTSTANTFYFTKGNCNPLLGPTTSCLYIDQPGQSVGTDVTRPSLVSPRIALTYQSSSRDVFRASYGRFIEYTPLFNIENVYNIEPAAQSCTIANACFVPLPGYSPNCVLGVDSLTRAPCNGINNLHQQIIEDLNKNNFAQYTPVRPQLATSADFSWEHDLGNGLELRITPYYRKGRDYVVASTPLLFNLPDGTSVFGSPRESNAGININTGVEFAVDRTVQYGLSGFIHATYDNTLANYNSDFFPSVNQAAVDVGHLFRVDYLAPVTATGNLSYNTRQGLHIFATMPYESGYYYGVGKHTFIYLPTGPNGALQAHEVLNTDLAEGALGNNVARSSYYFTDPTDPGTILNPNIIGSRGTPEGNDPGSLRSPQNFQLNLTVAHDISAGHNSLQAGLQVINVFGNYSNTVTGTNSRYANNGFGGYAQNSGKKSSLLAPLEPYQVDRSPFPYENEAIGTPRLYYVYLNAKF